MSEQNAPAIGNDVIYLRSRMESPVEFKKKIIGGFDEDDVIKYFRGIGEQLQKTEENFKVRIDEIEASNSKLRKELETYKDNFGKAVATAEELNGVIRAMKEEKVVLLEKLTDDEKNKLDPQNIRERDELTNRVKELEQEIQHVRASGKLDDELKASLEFKIANLEEEVQTCRVQLDESKSQLAEQLILRTQFEERLEKSNNIIEDLKEGKLQLEQRLGSENNGLSSWMSDIKNEMQILYKQMSDLEEMSNANNQLKQQLMMERVRAEKAEKNLSELSQLMSEVQNKISAKVVSTNSIRVK